MPPVTKTWPVKPVLRPRKKRVSVPDLTKVPVPTNWPSKDKELVNEMSVVGAT